MKKYIVVLLLAFWSAAQPSTQHKPIDLSLDVAQFLGSDGQSYLEIYYSLPEKAPLYVLENDQYNCDVVMSLEILQDDTLWANKVWRVSNTLKDTSNSDNHRQLVDLLRYPVASGHPYQITLFARDARNNSLDSLSLDFTAGDFAAQGLIMSDLQFGNSIAPYDSSCNASFRKRFYCIVPNPEFTFGSHNRELYYYFEIYNLQDNIQGKTFRIMTRVLDRQGEVITQVAPIIHEREVMQNMVREIGQFPMSDIPSGTYKVEYALTDSANTVLASRSKLFLVHNPDLKPLAPVFAREGQSMNFLDGFDEKRLDEEFDKLYAMTSKDDRSIYRSIKEADARRSFLYQFWSTITPPDYLMTADFRVHYMQDVQYVSTYYTRPNKPGWRTDRGITYLRYGKPSDIERHTVEKETKPYEIWHYEGIENGVIFVFVDRMGFNQYEMIHSTKRGELYDPNWQRLIQPTTTDSFTW
jgi:GWxTD domain-containing protein